MSGLSEQLVFIVQPPINNTSWMKDIKPIFMLQQQRSSPTEFQIILSLRITNINLRRKIYLTNNIDKIELKLKLHIIIVFRLQIL